MRPKGKEVKRPKVKGYTKTVVKWMFKARCELFIAKSECPYRSI